MAREKPWEKRDRRFYLVGPKKGQPRPSKQTRVRRRRQRMVDGQRAEADAVGEVLRQLEEEELAEAMSEVGVLEEHDVVKYRLVGGYRSEKDGHTWYPLENEDEIERLGRLVVLDKDDVVSGKRWFREGYPDHWMENYTMKKRKWLAERSLRDYGKQFVEYKGTWYEAEEVRK